MPSRQPAEPSPRQHTPPAWILTDAEWRQRLTAAEYQVLRQGSTEAPWTGEYTTTTTRGFYHCRACGQALFASDTKFDSHCGWPSFFTPLAEDRVRYLDDTSLGTHRTEVRCARCDSHLGHVFDGEGYPTPTDQRFCVNSISLTFQPAE